MGDIKNPEGYVDRVPYEALATIARKEKAEQKFRPLVYICSPYSGDVEGNRQRTVEFCRFAIESGQIPLAPHLMFPQFMIDNDPKQRELALFMDVVLMGKCSEVWVLGDRISEGMTVEISKAKQRRQKIRYFNSGFEEVDSI